jgi:hypothetical protein
MIKLYIPRLFGLILIIFLSACKADSQYDLATIEKIENRDAVMKCSDFVKHIYFEEGIIIDSPTLLDTIYMLEPVNLPEPFNLHDLKVTVSGEILENPGYSSHSHYTQFYISDIQKREDN